jgi:2-hydroxycyclohexanecarboxyl-CoA dehydrogenase
MSSIRVALVTGAGRGIGLGIARRLLADGMAVILWDVDFERVSDAAKQLQDEDRVMWAEVDVSDPASVRRARAGLLGRFGRLDVLVNNAGWNRLTWFLETDERHWDKVIGVNYRGVLNTCQYLGPDVVRRRGRMINIASDTAKAGYALDNVYAGAKGAVIAFSRALAREVAETGTTVNVICPGATDTPILQDASMHLSGDPEFRRFFPNGFFETIISGIPLGRLGQPEDVANAVSFLASADAESITGQVLSIDGGQTMYYGM